MFDPQMSPKDWEYFRYFQQKALPEISGGFNQVLWNVLVPQRFYNSVCNRHIALCISALSRANTARIPSDTLQAHYCYAFEHYGKALEMIRQYITPREPRSSCYKENTLVTGILVYCVEMLQGNEHRAIRQLQSLLLAVKATWTLQLQHCHLDPSSGKGYRTEMDELRDEIARLDSQLTFRIESSGPITTALGVTLEVYPELFDVPEKFSDIDTARRFLEGTYNFPHIPTASLSSRVRAST